VAGADSLSVRRTKVRLSDCTMRRCASSDKRGVRAWSIWPVRVTREASDTAGDSRTHEALSGGFRR